MWVCDPEFASRRLREITGEPLNSRSRILDPNKREITGVDCTECNSPLCAVWWPWLFVTEAGSHNLCMHDTECNSPLCAVWWPWLFVTEAGSHDLCMHDTECDSPLCAVWRSRLFVTEAGSHDLCMHDTECEHEDGGSENMDHWWHLQGEKKMTWYGSHINSLAPRRFEGNFRSIIFKLDLSEIDVWGISCEIALRCMSLDFTDD